MTPTEFRQARDDLGLTVNQMATALGVAPEHVRRLEMTGDQASRRGISEPVARLMKMFKRHGVPKEFMEASVSPAHV